MTLYTSLRTAIVAVLDGIEDIGAVHSRERFVVDPSRYLDLFKVSIDGESQIRAWLVLRESAVPVMDAAFNETRRRHLFVLRGLLGFKDSSDTYGTLQALADEVMAAFDTQTTLSTSGVIVHSVGPCSLRSFENVQYGSTLCHQAEVELPIETMVPMGTA